MKKHLITGVVGIVLLALAAVGVRGGQRIRVIDVDGSNAPVASAAINVSLTAATNAADQAVVKAGATQVALTLYSMTITNAHADVTNVVSVVTNVTVNTVFGFASTTPQVVVTNSSAGFSFTAAQANGILTNANLLYKLLQSY